MTATKAPPKTRKPNVGSDPNRGARVKQWQVGLYVFAIGASLVLLLANLMLIINGTFSAVFFIIALLITGLSWGLVVNKTDNDADPTGVKLANSEPALTAFVQSVADSVGAPMPDDLYLVTEAELQVVEKTQFFGLKVESSALRIGVPFLQALSQQEFAALLAYELAHYAPGDVAHGPRAIRGLEAARDLIAIERKGFVNAVYGSYARKMFRSVGGVGVAQEAAADHAAAEAYGTVAMRSALEKYDDVAVAFDQMLREYVVPALQSGSHPVDMFDGFGELLNSSTRRIDREGDVERRQGKDRSEFELHRTPRERLATIDDGEHHPGSESLAHAEAPAHELLDATAKSADIVVGRWASKLMGTSTEPRSWDQLVDDVYSARSHDIASLAFDEDDETDPGARFEHALACSASDDWDAVDAATKKPLKKVGDVGDRRHTWAECVVLDAASAAGDYEWQHSWDGPAVLADAGGNQFDSGSIAALLADGKSVEAKAAFEAAVG